MTQLSYKNKLVKNFSLGNNEVIKNTYFIIDFDSTFVTLEALDELAHITLASHPQKEELRKKIEEITRAGMEGKIDFPTSLAKRIALFHPTQKDILHLIRFLQEHITPSVLRNKEFFTNFSQQIYIISGGFIEYIYPIVKEFGIPKNHILANTFTTDKKNNITGFDQANVLASHLGKSKIVKQLHLSGDIIVIGDGITDYQIVEQKAATTFYAFVENIKRKGVVAKADKVINSFDELLHILRLPRSQSYPKSKMKVLLLENISKEATEKFINEGYSVEVLSHALNEEELIKKISDVSILGIRSKTEISAQVLEQAKKLLCIGTFSIGTNQINLEAAAKKGIAVFNAPYSNTRSVVELVLGEMIMLLRKVPDKSINMHKGVWDKSAKGSFEIRGKTLGIIGYGNIGSQLSILAEALGMHVYFYDVVDKLAIGNAKKCQTLEDLLKTADVISVHVDGSKTNKNLLGEKEFAQMKKGVIFLNLSRGHIVDVPALVEAVTSGKVAGCAVDVFPEEPKSNNEPFISPLQRLQNTILTPHIGGSTEEAQKNIGEFVSGKLMQFIDTGSTVLSVNFPNISLSPQIHAHRLIHIHNNTPGMLATINNALAKAQANILGQYLKTNDHIGYVITDVDKGYNDQLLQELRDIQGTIKVRVLY